MGLVFNVNFITISCTLIFNSIIIIIGITITIYTYNIILQLFFLFLGLFKKTKQIYYIKLEKYI